jgi:hypothetical protein
MLTAKDLNIVETNSKDTFEVTDKDAIASFMANMMPKVDVTNLQKPVENKIVPVEGFVVKTWIEGLNNEPNASIPALFCIKTKVFINLVHSPQIPLPPLISDEDLDDILKGKSEPGDYKIPMSLSTHREDKDKQGAPCLVWDACINSQTFRKTTNHEEFKFFIIELALTWVEHKNGVILNRNYSLPNLRKKGRLVTHTIKRAVNPIIDVQETVTENKKVVKVDEKKDCEKRSEKVKEEENYKLDPNVQKLPENENYELDPNVQNLPKPNVKLSKIVKNKQVEALGVAIELPTLTNAKECILDIEKKLLLCYVPEKFFLKLKLPEEIDTEKGEAVFDHEKGLMQVTLNVLK